MTTKLFTSALLASTLLIAPALAQSSPPAAAPNQPAPAQQPQQAQPQPQAEIQTTAPARQEVGQMRSTTLVGLNVYNPNNDRVGDINDLIVNRDGEIQQVIIGVGGFLGIGQRDVALNWDQVTFVDEPRGQTVAGQPAATTGTGDRPTTTTGTGAPATTGAPAATARNVPDHAVVDMTREQLEQLPEYRFAD
jgi:sporulation protein YlmC with PRC-barrel domain